MRYKPLFTVAALFAVAGAQSIKESNSSQPTTQSNSTGFRIQHGFETVLVQPFGFDGFRVRAWPFRPPNGNEISFLYDPPLEGPEEGVSSGMRYDITTNGSTPVVVRNGNTLVKTFSSTADNTTNVRLAFYRMESDGSETLLTNEYAPLKSLNPRYYSYANNLGYEFAAEFSFSTTPDEQIYGTGTQGEDHMVNKKGQVIDLINFNTHIPTPVFMSSKGYGFVWNSPAQGRIEFGQLRNRYTAESTTLVDYVIVCAPEGDYDGLQRKLSAATGRAPEPPSWSLGYLHSKLRYENQSEFIQLAQNFHDRNIPVSMLVIDYQSWAHQGDWGLDPALWPNVSYMAEKVKELTGAEIMASLWPSVEDRSENYATMQTEGLLSATRSGPGVTDSWNGTYIRNVDSTNPRAREFLWNTLKRNYWDNGIRNFWIDQADGGNLGEAYQNNGQSTFIQSLPYPFADVLYYAGTQTSAGKLYPWAHQQAIEEGLRNVTNTQPGSPCEYLSLSRSGYIGSQRFCSMIWSGDITSTWSTLSSQIASGLSAAATGWSWWTLDIGGFQADPTIWWSGNVDEEQYRELYVRWQQWAVFLPFFRNHGTRQCNSQSAFTCDNEPWSYGEEHTPTIVGYINLRYQLAPYLKAVFKQFSETGRMIMRPLYMDFSRTDPRIMEMTRVNANVTTQQ
jgi:alpha-D-xyloside xylohydrolase